MPKIATICDIYKTKMMLEEFKKAGLFAILMDRHPSKSFGFDVITTIDVNNDRTKVVVDKVTQYYIDNPPVKNKK